MMTAVYVISNKDSIEEFASKAREREFEGRAVYIGNVEGGVRSTVFVDGPPLELKKMIASGEDAREVLMSFKRHVVSMLKSVHVGQDDLRVFVHFGGQGDGEVKKFNEILRNTLSDLETFKCYAISFGNKIPEELFLKGIFTPPHGKAFAPMCDSLQGGALEENFEHLRALRLLIVGIKPDTDGYYAIGEIAKELLLLDGGKTVNTLLSQSERRFILRNKKLTAIFLKRRYAGSEFNWLSLPPRIDYREYHILETELSFK